MTRPALLLVTVLAACTPTASTAPAAHRSTTTTSSTTTTTTTLVVTTTAHVHTEPPEGMEGAAAQKLAAIKACESGGRYDAVSPSGRHRGAHQWSQETWDGVARRHRPDLEGDDPAAASPGDQEEMAAHLYAERGAQPWPACGRKAAS